VDGAVAAQLMAESLDKLEAELAEDFFERAMRKSW
jgi:hypothetical protein